MNEDEIIKELLDTNKKLNDSICQFKKRISNVECLLSKSSCLTACEISIQVIKDQEQNLSKLSSEIVYLKSLIEDIYEHYTYTLQLHRDLND